MDGRQGDSSLRSRLMQNQGLVEQACPQQSRPSPGEVHPQDIPVLAGARPVARRCGLALGDSDLEACQCLQQAHCWGGATLTTTALCGAELSPNVYLSYFRSCFMHMAAICYSVNFSCGLGLSTYVMPELPRENLESGKLHVSLLMFDSCSVTSLGTTEICASKRLCHHSSSSSHLSGSDLVPSDLGRWPGALLLALTLLMGG